MLSLSKVFTSGSSVQSIHRLDPRLGSTEISDTKSWDPIRRRCPAIRDRLETIHEPYFGSPTGKLVRNFF